MSQHTGSRIFGWLGATWAVVGILLLLGTALVRLTPITLDAWQHYRPWTALMWVAFLANLLFMAYSEGYKGFQKAFSPRAAARTRCVRDHPTCLRVLLAPLFIMCYFQSSRKRMIVSYSLTVGIIVLVLIVHQMSQPWRGILDAGVLLGLTWGLLSFLACLVPALGKRDYAVSPELE